MAVEGISSVGKFPGGFAGVDQLARLGEQIGGPIGSAISQATADGKVSNEELLQIIKAILEMLEAQERNRSSAPEGGRQAGGAGNGGQAGGAQESGLTPDLLKELLALLRELKGEGAEGAEAAEQGLQQVSEALQDQQMVAGNMEAARIQAAA